MFRKILSLAGFVAMLAVASSAGAQVWTAVAGSGAIEDTSLGTYYASGTVLSFRSGATGTVAAAYNVVSPSSSSPGWTNFELTARNPGGSPATYVFATLYRVPKTGTGTSGLCTLAAPATGAFSTSTCTFSSSLIDFNNYNYFARIILGRDNSASVIGAYSVRVY